MRLGVFLLWSIWHLLVPNISLAQTFENPLMQSGPDPWILQHDGYYYYTNTLKNRVGIWKTTNPVELKNAEHKIIWNAPDTGMYSADIWAPEIHFLDGKWYVYFAGDDGENENHRIWVLECTGNDPMQDEWLVKSKISDNGDHWAIDATILEYEDARYMLWSGWEEYVNGQQNIYISEMDTPWKLKGERHLISKPELDWELNGFTKENLSDQKTVLVNEGPQVLFHENKLFVIYSANGCWTDRYSLGILSLKKGGDPLLEQNWSKLDSAVFVTSEQNDVFSPGHNSFFKSPDGNEDWILYHANPDAGKGCGIFRSPRAQKFEWNDKGLPIFGPPVPIGIELQMPSKEAAR